MEGKIKTAIRIATLLEKLLIKLITICGWLLILIQVIRG